MNKNLKKFVSTLALTGVIVSSGAISTFANEKDNAKFDATNLPGSISIQSNLGEDATPGYIMNKVIKSEAGGTIENISYGLPMFKGDSKSKDSNGLTEVENFINWLKEHNPKFKNIFKRNFVPGSKEFDKAWTQASQLDEQEFALAQQTFVFEKTIKPIAEAVKEAHNIDLLQDRALEELLFSIVSQFGAEESANIISDSIKADKLTKKSSSEDIVDSIQKTRTNKISKNSVLRDVVKKAILNTIKDETTDLVELINEDSLTEQQVSSISNKNKKESKKEVTETETPSDENLKTFLGTLFKK